jgi:hypothetical protein
LEVIVKEEVPPLRVPVHPILPATLYELEEALKMPVLLIEKLPPIVQLAAGVTPELLLISTLVSVVGIPVTLIAPEPPNITVPVLVKVVPFS